MSQALFSAFRVSSVSFNHSAGYGVCTRAGQSTRLDGLLRSRLDSTPRLSSHLLFTDTCRLAALNSPTIAHVHCCCAVQAHAPAHRASCVDVWNVSPFPITIITRVGSMSAKYNYQTYRSNKQERLTTATVSATASAMHMSLVNTNPPSSVPIEQLTPHNNGHRTNSE